MFYTDSAIFSVGVREHTYKTKFKNHPVIQSVRDSINTINALTGSEIIGLASTHVLVVKASYREKASEDWSLLL